ncbi:MAG: metallophosphoesterase family protein [Planctomycetota bacterium]
MRLLCISDLHGNREALRGILASEQDVEAVLFAGDITNFGVPNEAQEIIEQAQGYHRPVLAVSGNCDSPAIDARLRELGVGLHGRGAMLGKIGVHGVSGAPRWQPGMYEFTEDELWQAMNDGGLEVAHAEHRVLLAHVPPHNAQVDRTYFRRHAGSKALRRHIDERQPKLVVCGHIHEARGHEMLDRTTVVNCGPAKHGYFAVAEVSAQGEVSVDLRQT